jgi:hypothetical protein
MALYRDDMCVQPFEEDLATMHQAETLRKVAVFNVYK